jgi:hypothetical protein
MQDRGSTTYTKVTRLATRAHTPATMMTARAKRAPVPPDKSAPVTSCGRVPEAMLGRRRRANKHERSGSRSRGVSREKKRQTMVLAMDRSHGVCCRLPPGVVRVVLCTFALHSVVGLRRGRTGPSSVFLHGAHDAHPACRASNINRPCP